MVGLLPVEWKQYMKTFSKLLKRIGRAHNHHVAAFTLGLCSLALFVASGALLGMSPNALADKPPCVSTPVAQLIQLTDGQTVSGPVAFAASVTNSCTAAVLTNTDLDEVEFQLTGGDLKDPVVLSANYNDKGSWWETYFLSTDVPDGTYTLTPSVFLNKNQTDGSPLSVVVSNGSSDKTDGGKKDCGKDCAKSEEKKSAGPSMTVSILTPNYWQDVSGVTDVAVTSSEPVESMVMDITQNNPGDFSAPLAAAIGEDGNWHFSWNTLGAGYNNHQAFYLTAKGTLAGVDTLSQSIYVNNNNTLETITAPNYGSDVSGVVHLVANVSAATTTPDSVSFIIDGNSETPVSATQGLEGTWNASFSSVGMTESGHSVQVIATRGDATDLGGSDFFNVKNIDVSLSSPADSSSVHGIVPLTAATDDGVDRAQFIIDYDSDNAISAEGGSGSWTGSWNTAGFYEGNHTIITRAWSHGVSRDFYTGVIVDNVNPVFVAPTPDSETVVHGMVPVAVSVTNSMPDSVTFTLGQNGTPVQATYDSESQTWKATIDTFGHEDTKGGVTLRVDATAGNAHDSVDTRIFIHNYIVTLTSPEDGATIPFNALLQATVTDVDGNANPEGVTPVVDDGSGKLPPSPVTILAGGAHYPATYNASSSRWEVTLPNPYAPGSSTEGSPLPNGSALIFAGATTMDGTVTSNAAHVTVDSPDLTLTLVNPPAVDSGNGGAAGKKTSLPGLQTAQFTQHAESAKSLIKSESASTNDKFEILATEKSAGSKGEAGGSSNVNYASGTLQLIATTAPSSADSVVFNMSSTELHINTDVVATQDGSGRWVASYDLSQLADGVVFDQVCVHAEKDGYRTANAPCTSVTVKNFESMSLDLLSPAKVVGASTASTDNVQTQGLQNPALFAVTVSPQPDSVSFVPFCGSSPCVSSSAPAPAPAQPPAPAAVPAQKGVKRFAPKAPQQKIYRAVLSGINLQAPSFLLAQAKAPAAPPQEEKAPAFAPATKDKGGSGDKTSGGSKGSANGIYNSDTNQWTAVIDVTGITGVQITATRAGYPDRVKMVNLVNTYVAKRSADCVVANCGLATAPTSITQAGTFQLLAPVNGSSVSGTVSFVTDVSPQPRKVIYSIYGPDGVSSLDGAMDQSNGHWVAGWDSIKASNGSYTERTDVVFSDGSSVSGNVIAFQVFNKKVTVNTDFSVSLVNPTSSSTLTGIIQLAASTNKSVDTLKFHFTSAKPELVFNAVSGNASNTLWLLSWDSVITTDGQYQLSAVASHGTQSNQSDSILVNIKNGNISHDTTTSTTMTTSTTDVPPPAPVVEYSPEKDAAFGTSIDRAMGYIDSGKATNPLCIPGQRYQSTTTTSVFYCGVDAIYHAFPNAKVYFTWFSDFAGIRHVAPKLFDTVTRGSDVEYRPGSTLFKTVDDSKVYAAQPSTDGTNPAVTFLLRWITTEDVAKALFGPDWAKKVIDVSNDYINLYKNGLSHHAMGSDILPGSVSSSQ